MFIYDNTMSDIKKLEQLEHMKNYIESMSKFNQIEILKILSKNLCKINENKSGVYINLSFLPQDIIDKMQEYIEYVKNQEESLKTMEYQKEEFKNIFFYDKEVKDEVSMYSVN